MYVCEGGREGGRERESVCTCGRVCMWWVCMYLSVAINVQGRDCSPTTTLVVGPCLPTLGQALLSTVRFTRLPDLLASGFLLPSFHLVAWKLELQIHTESAFVWILWIWALHTLNSLSHSSQSRVVLKRVKKLWFLDCLYRVGIKEI